MNIFLTFLYITWKTKPDFNLFGLSFHWYGILFGITFIQGYLILSYFIKVENKPEKWADFALLTILIGTLVGARLGHVFFYKWSYYKTHLPEIIMIWKGGLASHGGVIGVLIAFWVYSKIVTKKSILWILDRLMIPIAIGCFLIRFGNLINQEIIGLPSHLPWAFIFTKIDAVPRHPSQLYEGLAYLSIALYLIVIYFKNKNFYEQGYFTGIFFTFAFFARFLIEFTKENQSNFENNMVLNMGQILSIPFFIAGVFILIISIKKHIDSRKTKLN
ncbi:MAG: prolipoprotein diacylglyceryl transferase [Chlorobi bacterium]|nr:prolipoprotein diacylglyceryl transferase [Chlorobiota bacterium]